MDLELDIAATRVLGALMEKSLATPDYYPLSLSALTAACNQKSSREPVMNLSDSQVQDALDALRSLHLVRERGQAGGRVVKYAHRLDDELGLSFGFDRPKIAVLTLLMLRGPQTSGEIRTRSARLHAFDDVAQVEQVLQQLASAERGPYVCRLAREPGRREARFAQLFSPRPSHEQTDNAGEWDADEWKADAAPASAGRDQLQQRITALEDQMRSLSEEVARLRDQRG